jgi:hypothetical protein
MNDAACVRFGEGVSNLCRHRERFAQIGLPVHESGGQGFAFDVLQHDEASALLLTDLVNSTYIRVIESGRGLCLPQQKLFRTLIASDIRGEYLDSHSPVKPLVLR